jgi:hypothetical protein
MKPTVGRIVMYIPTTEDLKKFEDAQGNYGESVKKLPAIITNVWSDTCVNLKVIGDAPIDLWRTSMNLGDQPGNWNWPVIEPAQ